MPIQPGTVFATLPFQEELAVIDDLQDVPYPPLAHRNPGCSFNSENRTLEATVFGKFTITEEGISLTPCWKISEDKMLASVEVDHTDFNGNKVTQKEIMENIPSSLKRIGLELNVSAINHALKASARSGRSYIINLIEGTLPVPEQSAQLELEFTSDKSAGTIRDDGSIDFRERAKIHSVAEGEVLGTLRPPVPGIPGKDIFGTKVTPQDAAGLSVRIGQGVEEHEDDDGIITFTSTKEGVARFKDNTLEVTDLLRIEGDVDYNTGNIHAKHGSIHIKGDIKSGFSVASYEDVIVDGVVEKADIKAGGLVITGGVIMDGKNSIKAKGDVSAHFFHNAIVESGGDVTADQDVSHCRITAAGKVTVLGGKGIISGGHVISGSTIHASIIGNKSGVKTSVEIRIPSPTKKALQKAQDELRAELHKLDKAIGKDFDLSSLMSAPEEDRRILRELIKVRGRLQGEIRSIEESKTSFLCGRRQDIESKRIKADQKVYSGTRAIICGVPYVPRDTMESPSFRLDLDTNTIVFD